MSELFTGARVPSMLIGRQAVMDKMQAALLDPGDDLRVVTVVGPGGYGKTRILREVMRRAGHGGERQVQGAPESPADDWGKGVASSLHMADLIDMTSVRLATTIHFQHQLHQALNAGGSGFFSFQRAYLHYRNQLTYQSNAEQMDRALREAEAAFRRDHEALSRDRRVVWVLDTAEKFAWPQIDWAPPLPAQYSASSNAATRTADWLRDTIGGGWLRNTTILIAGRDKYDWPQLFAGAPARLQQIQLTPFDAQTTQEYVQRLISEWQAADPNSPYVDMFQEMAEPERSEVLWLYTGGQPVRLALFTDVMLEGQSPPPQLYQDLDEAHAALRWDGEQVDPQQLAEAQRELEAGFLDLLFHNTGSLRSQILAVLVRSQRPMNATSLAFLLYSKPKETIEQWRPDAGVEQKVRATLEGMRDLSFIKYSLQGEYWLQDEIYDLFDRRHAGADDGSQEVKERTRIYDKITQYLEYEIRRRERQLQEFWHADRSELLMEGGHETARQGELSPLQVGLVRFTQDDQIEPEKSELRSIARNELENLLLDSLYYRLRLNPITAYNTYYHTLADTAWLEYDDDFMTQLQIQLRRFLEDDLAWQFSVQEHPIAVAGGERMRQLLHRLAQQDAAIRVLKRLHMRGDYQAVLAYAELIRTYAETFRGDERAYSSWTHRVTQSEIDIYASYARIYLGGKETAQAAKDLRKTAEKLERALGEGWAREKPFDETHPARERIERLVGTAYLFLGYANASRGCFADALTDYRTALPYLRLVDFAALQAICMYSMARVLAERGHTLRAARICNDAINLLDSRGRGGTRPYGLAQNTLALVYNRGHEPEMAWREAAVAHACFEQVSDLRDLGLAKLQLGEALRRLGARFRNPPHNRSHEIIQRVFKLSEKYLRDALKLFIDEPGVQREVVRQLESFNELGSSLRDQAHYLALSQLKERPQAHESVFDRSRVERLLNEAESCFKQAQRLAQEQDHGVQLLDALWGLAKVAYTRYYMDEDSKHEQLAIAACADTLSEAERLGLLKPGSRIARDNLRPAAGDTEPAILRLLSHSDEVLARIHFMRFERIATQVREQAYSTMAYGEQLIPERRRTVQDVILSNPDASQALQRAVEHYTVALGYSFLYATRSRIVSDIYDEVYERLKRLSDRLMGWVAEEFSEAYNAYHLDNIAREVTDSPVQWLEQSFGYRSSKDDE